MVNLVSNINEKDVIYYGITEAYFVDECFILTCKNEISASKIDEIKAKLDKSIISNVLEVLYSSKTIKF